MQKYYNVDRNEVILYGVLNAMTLYHFSPEVKKKLYEFLKYVENKAFPLNVDIFPHGDIISDKLINVVTLREADNK